jgi:D-alanyl-D-alanine carboxypeptidase (penicillin-binding protein 5/6)
MCLIFSFSLPSVSAEGGPDLAPNARSAILMDAGTGTILFEKNAHEPLPPASITKVMTMLLVMEALDRGELKLSDSVRVSERAASMGGSQIYLEPGETMTVHDLLKGIAIASANDASVAIAEHLSGTEEQFVERMNQRAEELGMKNTHFQNSNGLPQKDHYSSAYDIAILSRELLKHEEIIKYTGTYQDYLRQGTKKPFWLVNTNRLVRFYPGVDGIKTGFTSEAKFCITATAKRGDLRLIAVVMGEPDSKIRNQEISQMLDYAFSQYESKTFYRTGDIIAQVDIEKGEPSKLEIRALHPISVLMKKGEKAEQIEKVIEWKTIKAPIRKGQTIGTLVFRKNGQVLAKYDLTSAQEVWEANFWRLFKTTLYESLMNQ